MAGRRADVLARGLPWLVAEQDGQVLGFAYANWFKPRPAYRFSAEDSIYLHPDFCQRGLGRALLAELARQAGLRGSFAKAKISKTIPKPTPRLQRRDEKISPMNRLIRASNLARGSRLWNQEARGMYCPKLRLPRNSKLLLMKAPPGGQPADAQARWCPIGQSASLFRSGSETHERIMAVPVPQLQSLPGRSAGTDGSRSF